MATKTITITEEAYNRLKMRRKPNASFSEVINRIIPFTDWTDFAGTLGSESTARLQKAVRNARKQSEKRAEKVVSWLKGEES